MERFCLGFGLLAAWILNQDFDDKAGGMYIAFTLILYIFAINKLV